MSVRLETGAGRAILVIWGADGTVLMSDHAEAMQFNGPLPMAQDYNIHVRAGPDGPAVYKMRVTLPPLDGEAWTRQQFGKAWDVAYPAGWAVNAAGEHEGAVQLEGPYGEHTYAVSLSYPIGITAPSLEAWVEEQLAPLSAEERQAVNVSDTTVAGSPAKKALNMPTLPAPDGQERIGHAVYIWRTDDRNPRLISVAQVDDQPFEAEALEAFLDRFLAEVRP